MDRGRGSYLSQCAIYLHVEPPKARDVIDEMRFPSVYPLPLISLTFTSISVNPLSVFVRTMSTDVIHPPTEIRPNVYKPRYYGAFGLINACPACGAYVVTDDPPKKNDGRSSINEIPWPLCLSPSQVNTTSSSRPIWWSVQIMKIEGILSPFGRPYALHLRHTILVGTCFL